MSQFAIFLDIDNTMTAPGVGVPERVKRALNAARTLGHKVFINTGRAYFYIPWDILKGIDFDGIICGLGSYISYGSDVMRNRIVDPGLVEEKVLYFTNRNTLCVIEGVTGIFQYGTQEGVVRSIPQIAPGMTVKEAASRIGVSKISIMRPITEEETLALKPLEVYIHDHYSETHFPGCDKGEAMLSLIASLGIPRQCCIAFGDSFNDSEMLKAAGHAVVVGNGRKEVKALAEFVAPPSSESGVADGLIHYIPEIEPLLEEN